MLDHLRPRPIRLAPVTPPSGAVSRPSRAAQLRLEDALRDRADAYRTDAVVDLTLVDALVRMDELEAASRTLDHHRASLQAMARDLAVAVADAAVEREAEHVWQTCVTRAAAPTPLRGRVQRRVMALTGAAAVVLALLLPTGRFAPRTTLASIEGPMAQDEVDAARQRLESARSTAATVRASVSQADRDAARRAVARDLRAVLAAGLVAPGGSVADGSAGTVTDLAQERADRAPARPVVRGDESDETPNTELAPVVPLHGDVPSEVAVDPAAPTDDPPATPDGDVAPAPPAPPLPGT